MDDFLYPLFYSDQSRTGSYTFYSNAAVDELLAAGACHADAPQRYNLYAQAEKLILTDMPAIPLYFFRDFRRDRQPHRAASSGSHGLHRHVGRLGEQPTRAGN